MSGMLARYEALIADGQLQPDSAQRAAAERLQRLQEELESWVPPKRRWYTYLIGTPARTPDPRGVYMWGGVGRGKSMLMDLFVETLNLKNKRRVHFHSFMLEVDALVTEARKSGREHHLNCDRRERM
ncbi:MAG: AFG1/ZapE family ATPase, partial [Pseudomonadota bacterium]